MKRRIAICLITILTISTFALAADDWMERYPDQAAASRVTITKAGPGDFVASEKQFDVLTGQAKSDMSTHFTKAQVNARLDQLRDQKTQLQSQISDLNVKIAALVALKDEMLKPEYGD